MKKVSALTPISIGMVTTDCATLVNGTNIDYTTDTNPSAAQAEFLGGSAAHLLAHLNCVASPTPALTSAKKAMSRYMS